MRTPNIRREGWTAARQLRFLGTLAFTRDVSRAAAAARMSRESAYRLRRRKDGALLAARCSSVNFVSFFQPARSGQMTVARPTTLTVQTIVRTTRIPAMYRGR